MTWWRLKATNRIGVLMLLRPLRALRPTRTVTSRCMSTTAEPSRQELLDRIAHLEAQLSQASTSSLPPPAAPKPPFRTKLRRSAPKTTKKPSPGPLPDILAKAPKRHVAFLFACAWTGRLCSSSR